MTATCTPASGATFSAGITAVSCRATDSAAQTASCSFAVTVTRPPQISATRYVAFGDSLTEGKQSTVAGFLMNFFPSYPDVLGQSLSSRYEDQSLAVDNEGLGGELTASGVKRLPGVLASYHPEVLLLLEGANDLLAKRSAAIPTIVSNLQTMVRTAKASRVQVLIATLPPQNLSGKRGYAAESVPPLNTQIADLARREAVPLVDLYAGFPPDISGVVGPDGLHLTTEGYSLVAQIFYTRIVGLFELPPSAAFAGR